MFAATIVDYQPHAAQSPQSLLVMLLVHTPQLAAKFRLSYGMDRVMYVD